jgi:MFS family permease
MLILGVALGLVLGLAAGGRIENLVYVRLRWIWLLFLAAGIRFGTEFLLTQHNDAAEQLRLPLLATAYTLLLVALYVNRRLPGMAMAFVGILGNAIAIVVNGGSMVVWAPSLTAAGFSPDETFSPLHVIVPAPLDANFLAHFGFLGDIIPIPVPILQNVASIGDLFLSAGLAFFLFATVVRDPDDLRAPASPALPTATPTSDRLARVLGAPPAQAATTPTTGATAASALAPPGTATFGAHEGFAAYPQETGVTPALAGAAALERPLILGGPAAGLSAPAFSSIPYDHETAAQRAERQALLPAILERARRHPYVRLALNGSFSAMWTGQLISLFGDRMNQIAMAFLVLTATDSPLAVGLVFLAATLPNLLLGPIAGTFVDRWNQKDVLVVSDLLRASLVLLVPIAAVTNLALIYPLVFLITSISIFFRPARTAILPRIVDEDELLTANSATWIAETLADVIGYPLAGLFVAFLGRALPLAFWFDAATYIASAVLIATMAIPTLASLATAVRGPNPAGAASATTADGEAQPDDSAWAAAVTRIGAQDHGRATDTSAAETDDVRAAATASETTPTPDSTEPASEGFFDELKVGWRFLRGETVLLANTLQGAVGQFTIGVLLTLTPFYAQNVLDRGTFDATAAYAFLETGIGLGNLVGGFVIGLIGRRLAKGRMVIAGYALWGLSSVFLAFTGNLGLALGLMFGSGVANMIYIIPSQTMFQERTPPNLIGRVVGFRFSLVFGSMTIAMGVSGLLATQFGVAPVIGFFGLVTVAAGLAGLFIPAVREA